MVVKKFIFLTIKKQKNLFFLSIDVGLVIELFLHKIQSILFLKRKLKKNWLYTSNKTDTTEFYFGTLSTNISSYFLVQFFLVLDKYNSNFPFSLYFRMLNLFYFKLHNFFFHLRLQWKS